MYTDEDLTSAVGHGIFNDASVQQFRHFMAQSKNTNLVDEENFRLISGFNDVFVVIASGLLLVSLAWIGAMMVPWLGALALSLGAWGLAEYFVRQRRMALPAIGLLLAFLGGMFALPILYFDFAGQHVSESSLVLSGILTAIAARMHWLRFKVPITVAVGTAAAVVCVVAIIVTAIPAALSMLMPLVFAGGLVTFAIAMLWDAGDRSRQTRRSDVAFWLHLAAAPMIVHPIFSSLGILDGLESVSSSLLVLGLYVVLALISIAVDRRAIMVSALIYVVFALSSLLNNYGMLSYSFAITGVCIGATLLLLSAFWQNSRQAVLKWVPQTIQLRLPELKAH
ncbi:hypothetical protein [Paraglaciecola hydrolytica]|uniref:DUF2157 domain-containing protein n=1 Tax=Paraglaciecola hydrolytica TaxID=1799789 RepID=A0A136A2D0_9ALTE|nr:hypothetical protein [Paraglaciecola hydrolytica]KXI29363.1 hypothetical protein AX660_14590 [Paraglaciecola hydrolytica]